MTTQERHIKGTSIALGDGHKVGVIPKPGGRFLYRNEPIGTSRGEWQQAMVVAALLNRLGGRVELTYREMTAIASQRVVVYEQPNRRVLVVEVEEDTRTRPNRGGP